MFDLVKHGKVITIDIEDIEGRPEHERITYLLGSSTSPHTVEQVKSIIGDGSHIMVILDSDHSKHHVLNEMRIYGEFVTKGNYLIVEDTNINHPIPSKLELGPMEAVEEFLRENDCFVVDRTKEKFFMTFNPNGYLKKVK
jgi:cephalosporin hydroxylase